MSTQTRRPIVGGIAGGVGTTTVAHLVDGVDVGVVDAEGTRQVDVLVTRATAVAVNWAISTAKAMRTRPILVVVANSTGHWPAVVERRLKMAATNLSTPVVRLGWCSPLAASDNPWELLAEAAFHPDRKAHRWANDALECHIAVVKAVQERHSTESSSVPAPFGGEVAAYPDPAPLAAVDLSHRPVKRVS
ncbi:hypothetical protein [Nocardia camponoti]|uniref:Uncharacterized protein n=1 Tax=Nocardia camponoti TaxID=1616106 RepID=A0A917VE13_9NOCA|nr:hypothetical protein [Nocardia camponoti]GGK68741.1 hypothetical protein GCM10011591_46060 [Nocardia camponoti]